MSSEWTSYTTAQALLEIVPGLGRLINHHLRYEGEEELTLMQVSALMYIRQKSLTTSELAKRRKVSLQSASVLVQGLVERGWLMRVPDPNDRRQSLLQLTDEGAARAKTEQERITTLIAEVLDGLEPEELEAASVLLPALKRVLNVEQLHPTLEK